VSSPTISGSSSTSSTVGAGIAGSVAQPPRACRGFPQIFIAASRRDQRTLVDCERSSTRGAAMSRFTMALAAAATAAVAAIAVVALPAVGDDSGSDDVSDFAACLRAHGLDGAPSDPMALKPWLARREASDPAAVKAAINACDDELPRKPAVTAPGPEIKDMIACVRRHGLDAPTDPDAFKRWVAAQGDSNALERALVACKMALDPGPKPGAGKPPADCGGATTPGDQAKPEESATRGV
jgi:hypothetical protein